MTLLSRIKTGLAELRWGIIAYSVVDAFLWSLIWVVQAPYLKALGFSPFDYGLYGSLFTASSIAALPLTGWLVDRFRVVKAIAASILLSAASVALMATGVKTLIYASAVLAGVVGSIPNLGITVLISRIVREERYHYAYSYIEAIFTLGNAAGSYAGWIPELFVRTYGMTYLETYRWTLLIAALLSPVAVVPLIKANLPDEPPSEGRCGGFLESFKGIPPSAWRAIGKLALAEAVIGLGAAISIHNISYYFILKYGVQSGELGMLYGSESLLMAVLMIFMPKVSEYVGSPLRAFVLVCFSSLPLLIAMTFINSYFIAAVLYIARTVLMNLASPLYTAFMMSVVPPQHRGKASSIIDLSRSIPEAVGRGLGGYLLGVDLELPLRITAALYTASLTYLTLAFRGRGGHSKNLPKNHESHQLH